MIMPPGSMVRKGLKDFATLVLGIHWKVKLDLGRLAKYDLNYENSSGRTTCGKCLL